MTSTGCKFWCLLCYISIYIPLIHTKTSSYFSGLHPPLIHRKHGYTLCSPTIHFSLRCKGYLIFHKTVEITVSYYIKESPLMSAFSRLCILALYWEFFNSNSIIWYMITLEIHSCVFPITLQILMSSSLQHSQCCQVLSLK